MPQLSYIPVPGAVTIIESPQLLHSVQRSTVLHSQPRELVTSTTVQRGQVVHSIRTSSHSPLRQQRASYCGGLQRSAEGSAPWASPRQTGAHRATTPLQRSGSRSGCRFYATAAPSVTGLTGAVTPRQGPNRSQSVLGSHSARAASMVNLHVGASAVVAAARVPEPPVPMKLGSATEKPIAELREELQQWASSAVQVAQ